MTTVGLETSHLSLVASLGVCTLPVVEKTGVRNPGGRFMLTSCVLYGAGWECGGGY